MRYVVGAISILLFLIILIFAIQNFEAVPVKFLAWSISMPKIFLILGTYVMGMLTGWGLVEVMFAVAILLLILLVPFMMWYQNVQARESAGAR